MQRASNREKNGLPAFAFIAMVLASVALFDFLFISNLHR
jgi:hypothetical protein